MANYTFCLTKPHNCGKISVTLGLKWLIALISLDLSDAL